MVKGWADHSSSEDEEEEVEHSTAFVEVDDAPVNLGPDSGEHETVFVERTYEYPTEPPFTAYVGNLSYNVTDGPMFADAMTNLVLEQLKVEMKFKNGRLFSDPNSNHTRHRGFGYIEVETVEELQKLMELNQCPHPAIDGRRITVDTSTQKGGGRNKSYSNHNSRNERRRPSNASNNSSMNHHQNNNNNINNRRNSSRSITSTHSDAASEGPKFRGGRHQNNNSYGTKQSDTPAASNDAPLSASSSQRKVVILKPRSKPMDGDVNADASGANTASSTLGGSSSSIFGDAKPRDEQSWRSQKESAASSSNSETDTARTNSTNPEKRPSTSSSQHQYQSGKDLKNSGRGSGAGRSGTRSGRGTSEGNNRGSGRSFSGRSNNSNATVEQGKPDKYKGATDGTPATNHKRKSDQKKAETMAAPAVPPLPLSKPVEPEKKVPAKPTNVFAALALDDSDSD